MSAPILHRLARMLPDGLTMRQLSVMSYLATVDGPQTHRSVSKACGIAKPVLTRIVNHYPQYIRRRKDQNDLRSVDLWLTDAGRDFVNGLAAGLTAAIEGEA